MTEYQGIDYGLGKTNISESGIRYGVIPYHEVLQVWADESEPYYGDETFCPYCGNESFLIDDLDEETQEIIDETYEYDNTAFEYACHECKRVFSAGDATPEDPISHYYDQDGYLAEQRFDDSDIFITKSPYYTYAQFCSPCAPGACYLLNPLDEPHENNRAFCLGHDWFESGKAPYPVYDVKTGKTVNP